MTAHSPVQFDIFEHARDLMLRNELIDALCANDAPAAHAAAARLAAEFPGDHMLADAAVLLHTMDVATEAPLPTTTAALAAQAQLADTTVPAARRALGAAIAPRWIAARWQALARRAAALPFDPPRAEAHAAALWLRAQRWREATDAVASIESWRRIPVPLAWMAEARWELGEGDACWPLFTELAWLAPPRFEALARRLPDAAALHRLMRRFDADFGDQDDAPPEAESRSRWGWFPAWLANAEPRLAPRLAAAESSRDGAPEQGLRLVLALLHCERQGRQRETIEHRRRLQQLCPALLRCHMATR